MSVEVTVLSTILKYGLSKLHEYVRAKRKTVKAGDITVDDNDVIIALELGRPIRDDIEVQLGPIDFSVSYLGRIDSSNFNKIAAECYQAIRSANVKYGGKRRLVVVISGPHGIIFPLGQMVGMQHFNIVIATFQDGQYIVHPPIDRGMMG